MKKIILIFIFILGFAINARVAQAHILKTDGSIGAVMHVTPDDDPIAGEESDFYFEFKDKEEKFRSENCDCKISVIQSGNEVFTQDLFSNNDKNDVPHATFSFTFPKRDIYKIIITGIPKTRDSFQKFTLIYNVRVERVSESINKEDDNSNLKKPEDKNVLLSNIPLFIFTFFGTVIILHLIIARIAKK